MLYLIHQLFTEWAMKDFYGHYKGDNEVGHHATCIINFVIWTPCLLIMAWVLTMAVDTPAKDFAYDCDMQSRIEPPKPKSRQAAPNARVQDKRPKWWEFILYNWKIWIFLAYLTTIITVAEIYN